MSFIPTPFKSTTDFYYQTTWRGFSPIFDQKSMPISWAVAAADSVVALARAEGILEDHDDILPLGVEQILDNMAFYNPDYAPCRTDEAGYLGHVINAYEYIKNFGIHTATGYQATHEGHLKMLASGSGTKYGARNFERLTINSFSSLSLSEFDSKTFVGLVAKKLKKQPLAAGIFVSTEFDKFKGNGIFEDVPDLPRYGHALIVTGFGHESGGKERLFWEVKNSYGLDFGDEGYAKIPIDLIQHIWYPLQARIFKDV